MPKITKIILGSIIGLTILATIIALVYFFVQRGKNTNPNLNVNAETLNELAEQYEAKTNTNTNTAPITNVVDENTETATVEIDEEESVLRLARVFVERYGSFSNNNDYENITSVQAFMTERFITETDNYMKDNVGKSEDEEYYGISTSALSVKMESFIAEQSAVVEVTTRRVETKGTADPAAFTQTIRVPFEHVGGEWKVDNAFWE